MEKSRRAATALLEQPVDMSEQQRKRDESHRAAADGRDSQWRRGDRAQGDRDRAAADHAVHDGNDKVKYCLRPSDGTAELAKTPGPSSCPESRNSIACSPAICL